jgi:putative ABC transport system permease protein
MFKNYFVTALRNLKKHKGFSFINLSGLAIGMACSILFALYVIFELNFDTYHTKVDRIYRVGTQFGPGIDQRGAFTAPPMAKALVNDFPEIENAARLSLWPRKYLVSYGEKKFLEKDIIFADNSIFDIFTFSHIAGNLKTALNEPFSIVITRDIAEKYFAEKNPIGESLRFAVWKKDFKITAVIENCPSNSHFKYRIIASMQSYQDDGGSSWGGHSCFTYITLKKGCSASQLEAKFPAFVKRYWGAHHYKDTGQTYEAYIKSGKNYYGHFLEPLPDIHLNRNLTDQLSVKGNKIYIYIFSTIAVFILLIACINFMNLSTARFENRSREVGVRKVLGSGKKQLIFQFLGESVMLSLFALILAIVILKLVMPIFCHFSNRQLEFNLFSNVYILPILVGFAVLVGILAGSYPAFFLSSFPAIQTIRNSLNKKIKGFIPLRRVLVILQFSITIVIFLGTFIIFQQLKFLQNSQLGFNKDQVLIIHRAYSLGKQRDAFKQELLKHTGILAISNTDTLPGRHFDDNSHKLVDRPPGEEYALHTIYGDCDFAQLLDLEMAAGRYFSPEITTDATSAVVINEAAVKKLGLNEPIGKRFVKEFGGAKKGEFVTIIGVVKDFHYFSLHHDILPMIIRPFSEEFWCFTSIKIRPKNIKRTINQVRETWNKFTAGEPFEYSFLDADFNNLYINEQKTGQVLAIFAFLAIFIACLGLFGMVSFLTEQRTKEIGIRKVLGAPVSKLIFMLSKEVIILVLLAFILAAPLAFYAMNKWLQNFAFRIEPNPLTFILMALITLLIALLTISFRTIKAACANPVDSIKHE